MHFDDPENREPTQAMRILRRLLQTPGVPVPMPELAAVSGAYAVHSRIAELRSEGHVIKAIQRGARPRISSYVLLSTPEVADAGKGTP